ncbi:MAG TPA: dTDP-glucose 4,6-dehydratase [Nitrospirota bacterium]|nr:dTDP-glucose 4,6-dehydratase [Nitrospirota bacterium]
MNKTSDLPHNTVTDLQPDKSNILVTGGAGFIGANFIRYVFEKTDFRGTIVNYDKLTYAGNLLNLDDIAKKFGGKTYFFERGDVRDYEKIRETINKYGISIIVHFAAESHVDRSIFGPKDFIETNINGTFSLLEAARQLWTGRDDVRIHHISTDEVYGSLGDTGYFTETTPYDPRSPYSASKAGSDHIVRAYYHTYGLPVTISNCSNNYGPYHFPEKLIPLMILNAIEGKSLPVYGDGRNVRDWLYVEDHCDAIWLILKRGKKGETYNIGGECEKKNIDVVNRICEILEDLYPIKNNPDLRKLALNIAQYSDLITFVADRPGHDWRYAINCDKIKNELGWKQKHSFDEGLRHTITWYLKNREWVEKVRSGEYSTWIEKNYTTRDA